MRTALPVSNAYFHGPSGACRMGAGQGICVLRQGILGHYRPLLVRAKGIFKDTFPFEGRGYITPSPPTCAPVGGSGSKESCWAYMKDLLV